MRSRPPGSSVEALDAPRATPQLLACLHGLADRTGVMLEEGAHLPVQIKDTRLSLEIAAIVTLARHFVQIAADARPAERERPPRQARGCGASGLCGAAKGLFGRLSGRPAPAPGASKIASR